MLVFARHKLLSRYLGPPPEFEGQNVPLFRVLLAEIVAESVCRKSLTLESKERTWEFRWADLKEDYLIADAVFAKFQQRMRDFVADAHGITLSDSEIKGYGTIRKQARAACSEFAMIRAQFQKRRDGSLRLADCGGAACANGNDPRIWGARIVR